MKFRKRWVAEAIVFALLGLALSVYPATAQDEFGYGGGIWFGDKMKVKNIKPLHSTFYAPELFGPEAPEAIEQTCTVIVLKGDNIDKPVKNAKGIAITAVFTSLDTTGLTMRVVDSVKFKTGSNGRATIQRRIDKPWGFNVEDCANKGMPGNCALPYFHSRAEFTNKKGATGVQLDCEFRYPVRVNF